MFKNLLDRFRKNKLPPILVPQLMDTYIRLPVSFVRGEGSSLWDVDGNEYIDAAGGGAATLLGHGHSEVSEAISLQASKLLHVGNSVHVQEQAQLASRLCAISGLEKVFFSHSPYEANLATLELITKWTQKKRGIEQPSVLCLAGHLPAQILKGVCSTRFIEFNDIDSLGSCAGDESIAAVLLPSMVCANGVEICSPGYLQAVRDLCDEHEWLLAIDENMTGIGRTGTWFAFQHEEVDPDIVSGFAALANGIPIGVCAARGEVASLFRQGDLCSQFGGTPLASQIALTVLNVIEQNGLLNAAKQSGDDLKWKLQQQIGTLPGVLDIRGAGMLIMIELEKADKQLASKLLMHGLLADVVAQGKFIRLTPALTLSDKQAGKIATIIHDVLTGQ